MVENFYQKRPSWTSESPGRRSHRSRQLQTSRDCTHITGSSGIATGQVLRVLASSSQAGLYSDATQAGGRREARVSSMLTGTEMTPRQRIAAHLPHAEKAHVSAERPSVPAEQQAIGQVALVGRAGEPKPPTLHSRRERRGRLYRGHSRWGAITVSKVKDRKSTSFEAGTAGNPFERTPSSSSSLSWEDVGNSVARLDAVTTLFTELESSSAHPTRSHQCHLRCRSGHEQLWALPANNTTSAFPCEKAQLSGVPTTRCARAPRATETHRRSRTVVSSAAAPRLDTKNVSSSGVTPSPAAPAPLNFDTARRATFAGQLNGGDGGGATEERITDVVACAPDVPLSLGGRGKSRQRSLSCPCGSEGSLGAGHRSLSRLRCRSPCIFVVPTSATISDKANDNASRRRGCVPPMSSSDAASHYFSFIKSRTSEAASFALHGEHTSDRVFGSNSVTQTNRDVVEESGNGLCFRTAPVSECGPSVVCPFYARGLCPAGAAAAAAGRPAAHQGNIFAESLAAEGTPSGVTDCAVVAPKTRESDTPPECFATNLEDRCTEPAVQVAPEHFECDACPYCMDTCDYMSCLRCLHRRCHTDALPPYTFNNESCNLASRATDSRARTHASAVAAGQFHLHDGEKGATFRGPQDPTPSPHGPARATLSSAEIGSPRCSTVISQTQDAGLASRGIIAEQGQFSCSLSSKAWVRTASVPASGVKSETLREENTPESLQSGGSWAPCSWFPYRCLRVLAPPARPPVSYSQCQVDRYCRNGGCWLIANGLIYDALPILYAHPGGSQCLLRKRGQDCSRDFAFHSKRGQQLWNNFVVGRVKSCAGWTQREQKQKEHSHEGVSCEKKPGRLSQQHAVDVHASKIESAYRVTGACRSTRVTPPGSLHDADEVAAAEGSTPEKGKLLFDTLTRAQDNIKRETATGQNHARATPGSSPSTAEGASFCRIM